MPPKRPVPAGAVGALGQAAAFSFFPSTNLGCLGDGAAIATSDDAVAEMANILRFHGSRDRATWEHVGYNSRLDEVPGRVLACPAARAGRLVRRTCAGGRGLRRAGPPGGAAVAHRGGSPGVAPLRCPLSPRRRDRGRTQQRCDWQWSLLPASAAPPSGDDPVRGQRRELPVTDKLAPTHLAIAFNPRLSEADAAQISEIVAGALGAKSFAPRPAVSAAAPPSTS